MSQIPLLRGVTATGSADFRTSRPVNLEPVPVDNGLSKGHLRMAAGAKAWTTGPGTLRGAKVWNGIYHAVMGTNLVSVAQNGAVTTLGDVGPGGPVAMFYGFDRLAIQSGVSLYYWDGITLVQVTDTDLGACIDVVWMDGYFVSFDGKNIVTTQLSDPTSIDPLKYGSAETDPDMITGGIRLRNELYVTGQNSIEVFNDVGGSGFPFQVSEGATIPIGCVGARAKCRFRQTFAFCGGGENEANGIWLAGAGTARKLSTRDVDAELAKVADLSSIVLESRNYLDEERLFVHLPDKTLVYYANASEAAQEAVWVDAASGLQMEQPYRLRFATLAYGQWIVGDTQSGALGFLDPVEETHFGEQAGWRFDTTLIYNAGKGGIAHDIELVGLPGRGNGGNVFLSFTVDGETYTVERANRLPLKGQRTKRVTFAPHKRFRNYLGMRFRGYGLVSWAACEARVEALAA